MNEIPTTAIGCLRLLASSKNEVNTMSKQLIESVKNGEVNPLEVLITLKCIEKMTEIVLKEIRDDFVKEANLYAEKTFEFKGAKVEKTEVGTKYIYDNCEDPIYKSRLEIVEEADKQFKERQEFLKGLKEPLNIIIEETGEVVRVKPPAKTSTTSLKITLI